MCLPRQTRAWGPDVSGPQTPGRMRSARKENDTNPKTRIALSPAQSESDRERALQYQAARRGARHAAAHFGRAVLLNRAIALESQAESATPAFRLIHTQLVRLGNNLNQLVRKLHQIGHTPPADLEPLLKDIRGLIARIPQ